MEVLRFFFILIFLTFLYPSITYCQTQQQLQEAFAKSYENEKKVQYTDAISNIVAVYDDNSYECNLRLAWLYYINLNYDNAILCYKKAAILKPASTEALWGLINIYVIKEDFINLKKTYQLILKHDPNNTLANYNLGLLYFNIKNYSQAKKHLDVALNQYPFNYYYLIISAWNYFYLGKFSEAKVLFQKVLLHTPNDSSALEGLSLIK